MAQIEFTTGSSCGNVKIVMTGLGRLKDIVLKRGSLSDHEPEALSRIIASVIAKGEVISRDAISRLRDGKK
ncbi:MAG: YbaB/EbfC family nucleoid-associated protein [Nitrososphaeraceae archaeon]